MVSFESPHYLRYALVLPLLVAGYLLSRYATARASRGLALLGQAEALRPKPGRYLAYLQLALRLLAFATLVLALANPASELLGRPALAPATTKLVFVVDVSNSMLTQDVLPDRLTQAQKVVAEVVRELPGAEIGIVVFASGAQLFMPLTTDYAVISQASATLSPGLVARQGTSLAEALALAGQVLHAPQKQGRVLCVLSDGESHTLGDEGVADSLRQAGIDLFAIGIGTSEGGNIVVNNRTDGSSGIKTDPQGHPIRSRLQEGKLRRIVRGQPNHYLKLDTWQNTTNRLIQEIRALAPPIAPPKTAEHPAYWQLCLLVAFGLLLLELLVPSRQQI